MIIRSKRTGKIYKVLEQGVRHLVQLIHPKPQHDSEKEPFYLDHDHYDVGHLENDELTEKVQP